MDSQTERDAAAFRAALQALIDAYAYILRIADDTTDRQQRFEQAAEVLRRIEEFERRAYDLRDRAIRDIFDAESLSLARLADRVGISKARADQIINPHHNKKKPDAGRDETNE